MGYGGGEEVGEEFCWGVLGENLWAMDWSSWLLGIWDADIQILW